MRISSAACEIPSPPWLAGSTRACPTACRSSARPCSATGRGKIARLTPRGLDTQRLCRELADDIQRRWDDRFTPAVTGALRAALEPLATGQLPPLFGGLEPYPDNWRASVRRPATLPRFPMVLHRGGYPDGS